MTEALATRPMQRLGRPLRMLLPFVWRELREQYAGSLLGVLWSVFQPALFILLYWWVFSQILQVRIPSETSQEIPFIAYLLSGLLPWFAFQDGLIRGTNAVVARREVIKKVHFPVQIFPLAAVSAAFLSHIAGFGLFLAVFFVWQTHVSVVQLAAIALLLALQLVMTAGLSLLFAAFTVYLRDTVQVIGVVLPAIFYTAPILYPLAMVPEGLQGIVHLNPFTAFAEAYHGAVLHGAWPSHAALAGLALLAAVALAGGRYIFHRLEPGFADVL